MRPQSDSRIASPRSPVDVYGPGETLGITANGSIPCAISQPLRSFTRSRLRSELSGKTRERDPMYLLCDEGGVPRAAAVEGGDGVGDHAHPAYARPVGGL